MYFLSQFQANGLFKCDAVKHHCLFQFNDRKVWKKKPKQPPLTPAAHCCAQRWPWPPGPRGVVGNLSGHLGLLWKTKTSPLRNYPASNANCDKIFQISTNTRGRHLRGEIKGTRGIKCTSLLKQRWERQSVGDKNVRAKLSLVKVISRHKILFEVGEKENVYELSCQKAGDSTRLFQISSYIFYLFTNYCIIFDWISLVLFLSTQKRQNQIVAAFPRPRGLHKNLNIARKKCVL